MPRNLALISHWRFVPVKPASVYFTFKVISGDLLRGFKRGGVSIVLLHAPRVAGPMDTGILGALTILPH